MGPIGGRLAGLAGQLGKLGMRLAGLPGQLGLATEDSSMQIVHVYAQVAINIYIYMAVSHLLGCLQLKGTLRQHRPRKKIQFFLIFFWWGLSTL